MPGELEKNLLSLEKPLVFASKNNFSNLSKIEEALGESVRSLSTKVLKDSPPPEIETLVTNIRALFLDFEKARDSEKRKKISSALVAIREVKKLAELASPARKTAREKSRQPIGSVKPSSAGDDFLSMPITRLPGVGRKVVSLLEKRSVRTVYDLLFYSPRKYDDRRRKTSIREAVPEEFFTLEGEVTSVGDIRNRRSFFQVTLHDGTERLRLLWFNYNARYLRGIFKKGNRIIVHGKVSLAPNRKSLQIVHPLPQDIEVIESEDEAIDSLQFGRIVPVYPLTEGLTQKKLRETVKAALDTYARNFEGLIPKGIQQEHGLINLPDALEQVHFPGEDSSLVDFDDPGSVANSPAHRTVIFFEFFILQLGLLSKKRKVEQSDGISFDLDCPISEKFLRSLPFSLTKGQKKAISEIREDMISPRPMNRLLQGDVGSGKTLVALVSMLRAVESGYQAALMVPTEILAEQHFRNIRRMTEETGVGVVLLKSALSKAEKSRVYEDIKTGDANIVVGTHALISEAVDFKALGFVIIDEQHRFGVLQRAGLVRKAAMPDVLVMTATPIPRTLAITVYGDLEVSVIDELPPSRKKVETFVLKDTRKNRRWFYDRVKEELNCGRQAYFIYPFIEESDSEDFKHVRHVTKMVEELREEFSEFSVSLLHGRMKSEEREAIMNDFLLKRCDILVSTTVIEVGVDVPNATMIVIENAERFGLSQLHQMRGRVGRGECESTCYIVYSPMAGDESGDRLKIMGETSNGFKISETDLANRGPGEFMGTKQSGVPGFSFASLIRDSALLNEARDSARELTSEERKPVEHEKLFRHVTAKWGDMLELDTSL